MYADLALIAVVTEAMAGYPDAIYRAISHPVTWIGGLIAWCDKTWNSETLSYDERRWRGVYVLVLLLAVAILSGLAITAVLEEFFHDGMVLLLAGVAGSSMLAQRSLYTHVAAVASALEADGIEAWPAGGVDDRRPRHDESR
jgi:adenosylcobinamide-phosphate synthase